MPAGRSWPRSGRSSSGSAPTSRTSSRSSSGPATASTRDDLVGRLVDAGYRREDQVEHRGEVAVRGSIVDVFPSTADGPVRIDLWGDEVDRLTEFSVADQRSTDDVDVRRDLPVPGAAAHRRGAGAGGRARRRRAVGPGAVGAAGRGPRLRRHGVVAAVADRAASTSCPTCWPPTPWSCWSSPAACATGPPTSSTRRRRWPAAWPPPGARPTGSAPASTSPSTACSPTPRPRRGRSPARPRARTSPPSRAAAGTR